MANRFEWLTKPGEEIPSEQYVAIINALGDWIEAQLECQSALFRQHVARHGDDDERHDITVEEIEEHGATVKALMDKQRDARQRAIEAGYVWRMDLDREQETTQ